MLQLLQTPESRMESRKGAPCFRISHASSYITLQPGRRVCPLIMTQTLSAHTGTMSAQRGQRMHAVWRQWLEFRVCTVVGWVAGLHLTPVRKPCPRQPWCLWHPPATRRPPWGAAGWAAPSCGRRPRTITALQRLQAMCASEPADRSANCARRLESAARADPFTGNRSHARQANSCVACCGGHRFPASFIATASMHAWVCSI